jgi:sugar/nucleoside kinase (ribokinase family)
MKHVPAFQVKVVDSNGAGDAFMGGLSFGLL